MKPVDAPLILILAPALLLFAWQLWRSLERFAGRGGGRRGLGGRAVTLFVLAVAALVVWLIAAP
ncbi:MAG: hypothetical protein PVH31_00860 [Ectothiorhodospiraceae bacterium]